MLIIISNYFRKFFTDFFPETQRLQAVELSSSAGSSACISLDKDWYCKCESYRQRCCSPETSKLFLPTRLVYVGDSICSSELHLHITCADETGETSAGRTGQETGNSFFNCC